MNNKINKLKNFINFLSNYNLIDKSSLHEDSDNGFTNRLKLQKFVYLAQTKFGWELGYDFSIYKYGPYSPTLADDYYDEFVSVIDKTGNNYDPPTGFLQENFLELVKNSDSQKLEVAATLLSLSFHFKQKDLLLNRITNMKPHIQIAHIKGVYDNMVSQKLIEVT